MRNVLRSSSEVMHYWANRVQYSGRAGNVSFEGDKLYSYAACIARHLPDGSVAISNHSYSVTTSGHQSGARQAARHLKTISVPYPGSVMDSKREVERNIDNLRAKASVARSRKDEYIDSAVSAADSFNAFAEALGSSERIDRNAVATKDLEAIRARVKEAQAKERARKEEQQRIDRMNAADAIAAWRSGEYIPTWKFHGLTILRVVGDEVQTSHGARIPVEHAKRLWPLVMRVLCSGKSYNPTDKSIHLGVYQLNMIRADGSIVVGCHDIPYSELETIARKVGLIEEEVTA